MNRWPHPMVSYWHVCKCGHHMVKPKDSPAYCINVMCKVKLASK